MTTPDATPDITDIFSRGQLGRFAALQGVAAFSKGMFGTTNPGVLIELAEYVVGEPAVPFDPVALAHQARADIAAEPGYCYEGATAGTFELRTEDWEDHPPLWVLPDGYHLPPPEHYQDRMEGVGCHNDAACAWCGPEPVVEPEPEPEHMAGAHLLADDLYTVGDLAGFLTLPETAILEDEDGDIWHHYASGEWGFAGAFGSRTPSEIFTSFGDENDELFFVVTNPEVLSL